MTLAATPTLSRAFHRLGKQIRRARHRRCWTQRDLALQTGLSVNAVCRVERGDPGVALSILMRGAMVLGQLRAFNRLLECWVGQPVPRRSGRTYFPVQGVAYSGATTPAFLASGYSQSIHSGKEAHLNIFGVSAQVSPASFAARVLKLTSDRGFLDTRHEGSGALGKQIGVRAPYCLPCPDGLQRYFSGSAPGNPSSARPTLPSKEGLLQIAEAVLAFECGRADIAQLQLLLFCTTALGGSRAKCSWMDENGSLRIAKFSSGSESLSLNRAEVLTMRMARMAGIDALDVRLLDPIRTPILVAPRLDHLPCGEDRAVPSARSLLRADENDAVDLLALLELMRVHVHPEHFAADVRQLWQRLTFMCLTHHAGDCLRKIEFICAGEGYWRLAPACGLRVHTGSLDDLEGDQESGLGLHPTPSALMTTADAFGIGLAQACDYLRRQVTVLSQWKPLASQAFVNMSTWDLARLEVPMFNSQLMGTRMQQNARRGYDSPIR